MFEATQMADADSDQGAARHLFAKMSQRKELLSTAMERTTEWIHSLEIPTDLTVRIRGTSLSMHKLPLLSKCGLIRKLLSESARTGFPVISIPDVPGGADAFELAAKFCYGINFTITAENAAMLRCAAEFLEMTEEYAVGNLAARTEAFVNEVVLKSLPGSVSVLHSSERLLPVAERVKLVSRCIDAIAFLACKDSPRIESLTILRLDFFRRVVVAMKARGVDHLVLSRVLVLYAQKTIGGLELKTDLRQEHQKRVILETIVSLLPQEKNTIPVSILSVLLRAAIYVDTTVACRLDLESRIALHVEQATANDLLLFDVETVKRIVIKFLGVEMEVKKCFSLSPAEMERMARLMESYLTEVSSYPDLQVSEFVDLAELIPQQFRSTEDGIYRAIDIYLKAHPTLSDTERVKVCSVLDCEKLSPEARAHVAKNNRLPVQTIVRVLCHEQQRLREAMNDDHSHFPAFGSLNTLPVTDEVSTLRKENQGLKHELVQMKWMLKEMERSSDIAAAPDGPPRITPKIEHWKSFIGSLSRRFGRFTVRSDGRMKSFDYPGKARRHSVS